ncbi:hypothetical protein CPB86DRAFT_373131 [Serendipita vermifera]|nr:hypothetical protein CPB86DRAFT_373131 [Serendipita vermifera]
MLRKLPVSIQSKPMRGVTNKVILQEGAVRFCLGVNWFVKLSPLLHPHRQLVDTTEIDTDQEIMSYSEKECNQLPPYSAPETNRDDIGPNEEKRDIPENRILLKRQLLEGIERAVGQIQHVRRTFEDIFIQVSLLDIAKLRDASGNLLNLSPKWDAIYNVFRASLLICSDELTSRITRDLKYSWRVPRNLQLRAQPPHKCSMKLSSPAYVGGKTRKRQSRR